MFASSAMGVLLSGGSVIDLDGTFFVQMGVFFAAFVILRSLVFRPVMDLLDAREAAVGGAKGEAQSMQTDAEARRDHFESEMKKVRAEAIGKRDALRVETRNLARELTDKARSERTATLAEAQARLDAEADKIRTETRAQIPILAREIASKLLDRSVN